MIFFNGFYHDGKSPFLHQFGEYVFLVIFCPGILSRWWFFTYFWSFHPENLGEMFQFDYTIFFRWVGNKKPPPSDAKSKDAKGTHWHDGSPVNLAQRGGPEASTEPPPLLTSFEAERQWRKCYEVLRHDPKWPVSRFTEKGCLACLVFVDVE